jgi:hypothetical protein
MMLSGIEPATFRLVAPYFNCVTACPNNSIQFSSSLLMCPVYGQKASYRNSTTQIATDNEQDTNETDKNKQTSEYLDN